MLGLSDIHLFTVCDLDGNPIQRHVSDTLKLSTQSPDNAFMVRPSSEEQCGSLSVNINKTMWDIIFDHNETLNGLLDKQKVKAKLLCDEINRYLEKKCEEYCEMNRIPLEVWFSFATSEYAKNKWEVRYKGELVCGAKVNCELKDDNSMEVGVSLELY